MTTDAGAGAGHEQEGAHDREYDREHGGAHDGAPGGAHDGAPGGAHDGEHVDELPDDLDVTGLVGPYTFPNNNRRRIPGTLYLVAAAACVALWAARHQGGVLVNGGLLVAGIALAAIGGYHWLAGYGLNVTETDALVEATRQVGFPVGHASAQLGWRGLRSRPTWRILLYSAEDPPAKRGLVLVDGVVAGVVAFFVEDNPEDWSALTR